MQEALRKRLILLAFVPAVIAGFVLAGASVLALTSSSLAAWLAARGMELGFVLGVVLVAAVFIVGQLLALLHVCRIAGNGTKALAKTTETGRVDEKNIPGPLHDDVEYNVLARRIEQLARGGREVPGTTRRLALLEDDLRAIAAALEEVSVGSPYIPLAEKEGASGKAISLLNKVLPEFYELRRTSTGKVQSVEAEIREMSVTSRELAETAEQSFLGSTEALVVAREAGRLAEEVERRLHAVMAVTPKGPAARTQKEEIRTAVTRLIETAAGGIEELTKGVMRAGSLTRSSERIANRASVLALNLAVESAKGSLPGMSVLVDEVRGLADFARACSDESAGVIRDFELQVDTVVRNIHVAQEEIRHRTRLLGLVTPGEEAETRETDAELGRLTAKLCDSVGKLLAKAQELSKLTEKTSRDAERLSRKTFVAHDRARTVAEQEGWKSLGASSESAEPESLEIQTLSDEDIVMENSAQGEQQGEQV